jgi:acyl-coenzyme A thioesterase PaaI-like protein
VRAGALATLVDVAAAEAAVREVRPEWVATSELVLHALAPLADGPVEARPSLLRRTRRALAIEVALAGADGREAGLATVSFAVMPAREGQRRIAVGFDDRRSEFALPGSGLDRPLAERLGVRTLDAAGGALELALEPYVGNSLGALQGGVTALLAELAAEAAGAAALGEPVAVRDLALHYLALAREGPVSTAARVLRREPGVALVRVELRDAGGALAALATVGVARV